MRIELFAMSLWGAWALSWLSAAAWSSRTTARPGGGAEAPYRILNVVGFLLVIGVAAQPAPVLADGRPAVRAVVSLGAFGRGLWVTPAAAAWALVGVEAAGFAVCWWARLHLGRLWSGWVTRKEGHRVVDSGPYRFVRHPIYTGLLLSALATALLKGSPAALTGFAVLTYSFVIKARLEEGFLRAGLGEAAYDCYAARTPMLVPGLPVRSPA